MKYRIYFAVDTPQATLFFGDNLDGKPASAAICSALLDKLKVIDFEFVFWNFGKNICCINLTSESKIMAHDFFNMVVAGLTRISPDFKISIFTISSPTLYIPGSTLGITMDKNTTTLTIEPPRESP